jgi:hypothetical protein
MLVRVNTGTDRASIVARGMNPWRWLLAISGNALASRLATCSTVSIMSSGDGDADESMTFSKLVRHAMWSMTWFASAGKAMWLVISVVRFC